MSPIATKSYCIGPFYHAITSFHAARTIAKGLNVGIIAPMLTLEVKGREAGKSADTIRGDGFVPAVLYGPKEPSQSMLIDARKLEQVWKVAGKTSLVRLVGLNEEKDTLIKDIQMHPVTGRILHADFYALEKGKKVQIAVPLEFIGEAPAEKAGHVIVKALHAIESEVAPQDLPHNLPVDLAKLVEVGDNIAASQIALPSSATLITHGEDIIASVTAFIEEKEPEAPVETAVPAEGAPAPETTEQPA